MTSAAISLGDVIGVLDGLYPPGMAEPWDAVGLVCGDPQDSVRKVLFAVDPVQAVVDEALDWGAQLLVTHHPLYLKGTSSVAASSVKGALVHRLIRGGCGLFVAHTNADRANPGVSDALAAAVGLVDLQPLIPGAGESLDKLVTFVPEADAERLLDALAHAGAGTLGDYERCAFLSDGLGTFRPLPGADPAIGSVGEIAQVAERRIETVLPRWRRPDVLSALRASHPYEEPAFDLLELAEIPDSTGLGRVGRLPAPMPFRKFVATVGRGLPSSPVGVRAAGNPDREIRTVAVVGGAGDSLFDAVRRSGVDAYVTADLRHHAAGDAVAAGDLCLIDAGHWATEWPWLESAADRVGERLGAARTTVELRVSSLVTDPWTLHIPSVS